MTINLPVPDKWISWAAVVAYLMALVAWTVHVGVAFVASGDIDGDMQLGGAALSVSGFVLAWAVDRRPRR